MLGPLMSVPHGGRHPAPLGVGLVEMLVAVAIVGVLAAVAIPSIGQMLERRRVIAVADEIKSLFAFAKAQANTAGDDSVDLHMENDPSDQVSCMAVTVFNQADTWKCYQPQTSVINGTLLRNFQIKSSDGVSFKTTATQWALFPNRITFLRNRVDQGVQGLTVTVTGKNSGAQLRLDYNGVGMIHTCSPHGSIGGYPVCS